MTALRFDLSKVTLDGTGHLVLSQGIRDKGQGTIDDCAFTNIAYPGYLGVGICGVWRYGYGAELNVDVTNSVFSGIGREGVLFFGEGITNSSYTGNTYTGKGHRATGWIMPSRSVPDAEVSLSGNTVSNNTGVAISDGSTSEGVSWLTTYFGRGSEAMSILPAIHLPAICMACCRLRRHGLEHGHGPTLTGLLGNLAPVPVQYSGAGIVCRKQLVGMQCRPGQCRM